MVNKDNQILLNKLVEISNGKWSSVATAEMARTGPGNKNRGKSTVTRSTNSAVAFTQYG
jgi:hypothetical protein